MPAEEQVPCPPRGPGADVVLDEHAPSDDGHGDDGRLLEP